MEEIKTQMKFAEFGEKQNMPILRPYQEEIIRILKKELNDKSASRPPRLIVQLPTGMGKTVIFAQLLADLGIPTLVLAHREELLFQAREKISRASGLAANTIDIILQSQPNPQARIWVASVQTLTRGDRLDKIKPELMIIDECHHSCAKTYQNVIFSYPGIPVVGFTATPTRSNRTEKKNLAELWDKIVYQMPIKKAVLDGWLANILYYRVKSGISLNDVKTSNGDFQAGDLSKRVNAKSRNQATVSKYQELGGGKAVVFCVDVEHAINMQAEFEAACIESIFICGDTDKDTRRETLEKFQASQHGKNLVITNCGVLTEGWDCPDLRQVILARPTKSEILYLQMLGRGTRKSHGKNSIIVVDIADNCRDERLCNCLKTVFGLRKDILMEGDVQKRLDQEKEYAKQKQEESASQQQQIEIEIAKILFDMPEEIERSRLAWCSPETGEYTCYTSKTGFLCIKENALGYTLYNIEKFGFPEKIIADPSLDVILREAETVANRHQDTCYIWDKAFRINLGNKPVSEKQIDILKKIAPQLDSKLINRETASQIISAHMAKKQSSMAEPASAAQKRFLIFLGYKGDTQNITKGEAGKLISQLKTTSAMI